MPTLQDVAQRAGVSIATVSKVLSNTPYVAEATRERVLDVVRELGYTPNLAARALSTGKTQIIAVVFPYLFDAIFQDPLAMQILEGIEAEATARGYNLLLNTPRLTDTGPDDSYRQLLQSGYIDGTIALDHVPVASVVAPARERGIPAVAIGYHTADYTVRSDDEGGGQAIMQHMLALGHRRIGLITVPKTMNMAVNTRLQGMRSVLAAYGLSLDDLPAAHGSFSVAGGARAAADLLQHHPDLTALVCLTDRMAVGAMQKLRELNIQVPGDVSVAGYDNIALAAYASPPLTTIDQQAAALGRAAAQTLFSVLDGHTPEPVVLPVRLVPRDSTAAPPALPTIDEDKGSDAERRWNP